MSGSFGDINTYSNFVGAGLLNTLLSAKAESYRDTLLHSPDVDRVVWVRHPVTRTLAGWKEIHKAGTPEEFEKFVLGNFILGVYEYESLFRK
jgi:hypothetical protein